MQKFEARQVITEYPGRVTKKAELELSILVMVSSSRAPKSLNEISREVRMPEEICRLVLDQLTDVGLLAETHDSDAYGHEILRFKRRSRTIA